MAPPAAPVVLGAARAEAVSLEGAAAGYQVGVKVPVARPAYEEVRPAGGYARQRLVATFPVTPGYERYIHRGTWTMKNCFELPQWTYDSKLLKTGKRSRGEDRKKVLNIPAGPNNPVGILWAGLSKSGIGIHGTSSPEMIGRSRSAGCIRLTNWDAARLPDLVRPGATVIIR